jgi:hypothetical protein
LQEEEPGRATEEYPTLDRKNRQQLSLGYSERTPRRRRGQKYRRSPENLAAQWSAHRRYHQNYSRTTPVSVDPSFCTDPRSAALYCETASPQRSLQSGSECRFGLEQRAGSVSKVWLPDQDSNLDPSVNKMIAQQRLRKAKRGPEGAVVPSFAPGRTMWGRKSIPAKVNSAISAEPAQGVSFRSSPLVSSRKLARGTRAASGK